MYLQIVKFESALTDAEAVQVAEDRAPAYRDIPELVQKYYIKGDKPNTWMGVMLWESAEALAKFRESELGQTIPTAYGVRGKPDIEVHEVMFPLR